MNGRGSLTLLQQPRLCGLSARARSRVTLRKMLGQFPELVFFVALECQICAALAKAQPAQPPSRMSSAFPNAGDAVEDTHGSCMISNCGPLSWQSLHTRTDVTCHLCLRKTLGP